MSRQRATTWLLGIAAALLRDRAAGQCRHRVRPADRVLPHRHADLDRARPHGAGVPVHAHQGADRGGGAEAVHRHREVRDHGDPVLHPRRQLPHARRRRETHDQFRDQPGRALARRAGARVDHGGRAVLRGLGLEPGDGRCDRLDHAAGDGESRLPEALRGRRHHHRRIARQHDPAVDRDGDLRGGHERHARDRAGRREGRLGIGGRALHGGPRARHHAGVHPRRHRVVSRMEGRLSAHDARRPGASAGRRSSRASGA